jgi:hypothetical protein
MNKGLFALLALALAASPAHAAGVKLTIDGGKVSIDAQDATVRQILDEWARVGKTRIVNLERISSGPLTIKLDNVAEDVALDILLRAVPGYMAAPRATHLANASVYDRIFILATTSAAPPPPNRAGMPGAPVPAGYPPTSPNITALRTPGSIPGVQPPSPDAGNPLDDPAIAAAAAAGLVPAPAPMPTPGLLNPGMRVPIVDPATPVTPAPATPPSYNPFNVPTTAKTPGLAPPPASTTTNPTAIRPPQQPDR